MLPGQEVLNDEAGNSASNSKRSLLLERPENVLQKGCGDMWLCFAKLLFVFQSNKFEFGPLERS